MAEIHPTCLRVGRVRDQVFIQPAGQCTFTACPAIEGVLQHAQRPETADVFFDLSQTDALDSTFAGFLVALAKRSRSAPAPALHLLNPTPAAREALKRMHILSLMDLRDSVASAPADWRTVDRGACDRDGLRELVRGAHEQLIDADPEHAAEYQGVVRRMAAGSTPDGSKPATG